jgi:hypothetical protein
VFKRQACVAKMLSTKKKKIPYLAWSLTTYQNLDTLSCSTCSPIGPMEKLLEKISLVALKHHKNPEIQSKELVVINIT